MSAELYITRGYPASGKTTWAQQMARWSDTVSLSRDDLRWELFDRGGKLDAAEEATITRVHKERVAAALKAGFGVIVDDTNLRAKTARNWANLARDLGAGYFVQDFPVDVDECIRRNAQRADAYRVPEEVIRNFAQRYPLGTWPKIKADKIVEPEKSRKYVPDLSKPLSWIFDIDGTLANHEGVRDPYDNSKYDQDQLHIHVAQVADALEYYHDTIIIMSGRDAQFADVTREWLDGYAIPSDHLFMRPKGDRRRDEVVKEELFWEFVAPNFNVRAVFDDRDRVVSMWRRIGVPCFQVAPGDF